MQNLKFTKSYVSSVTFLAVGVFTPLIVWIYPLCDWVFNQWYAVLPYRLWGYMYADFEPGRYIIVGVTLYIVAPVLHPLVLFFLKKEKERRKCLQDNFDLLRDTVAGMGNTRNSFSEMRTKTSEIDTALEQIMSRLIKLTDDVEKLKGRGIGDIIRGG